MELDIPSLDELDIINFTMGEESEKYDNSKKIVIISSCEESHTQPVLIIYHIQAWKLEAQYMCAKSDGASPTSIRPLALSMKSSNDGSSIFK